MCVSACLCVYATGTDGTINLADARHEWKDVAPEEKAKFRDIAQAANRHDKAVHNAKLAAEIDRYNIVDPGYGSWGLGDQFHALGSSMLAETGYLHNSGVVKQASAEWELTGKPVLPNPLLNGVQEHVEFCSCHYSCCLTAMTEESRGVLDVVQEHLSMAVVQYAPQSQHMQPVIEICLENGARHFFQCLFFTQAQGGNPFHGVFLRYLLVDSDAAAHRLVGTFYIAARLLELADCCDNNDIAEEIAASTSTIASMRHLVCRRGRDLKELKVVGGHLFDLQAVKTEQQEIREAAEQVAIAKRMLNARAPGITLGRRKPRPIFTQRVAQHCRATAQEEANEQIIYTYNANVYEFHKQSKRIRYSRN